jgi:alkaline phosphatase D
MVKAFIPFVLLIIIFSCHRPLQEEIKKLNEPVSSLFDPSLKPFYHGVASGDPLLNSVIIWTRVTPDDSVATVSVRWEISESESFDKILQSDTVSTSPDYDYTVKVDVQNLEPATFYYYRFKAFSRESPIGRTKTISANSEKISIAVVSCSNWEFGYFNAYRGIAKKELDAVVHLGDYIYETPRGGYGNKEIDRKHLPEDKLVSLTDYRTRYSQYHLDEGLRLARMKHPFITVWDDHEVANDVYAGGAKAHDNNSDGDFFQRKAAAKKAYYEWMPIREKDKLYRTFVFGKLASLIMLDERLEGREKQLDQNTDSALFTDRTMLGKEQLAWFENELKDPRVIWKIIGNQVLFSDLDQSPKSAGHQRNLDSWDGYPVEKKAIEDFIIESKIKDVVFLAGDTHASWAFNIVPDPFSKKPNSSIAVEFGATSISSGNANESAPDDSVKLREQNLLKVNPHLKYINQRDHGYLLLTVTPEKVTTDYYFVETLAKPDERERLEKSFSVQAGKPQLK